MSIAHTQKFARRAGSTESELRELVDEIVYARALIRLDPEEFDEHDRPLRLALGEALDRLADTDEERRRIADDALKAAWARVAAKLEAGPQGRASGSVASAA